MTQEQKEILIKDLCGRLPYGIFVEENRDSMDKGPVVYTIDYHPYINDCKPYLRPISSMTDEEKKELSKRYVWEINGSGIKIKYHSDGCWDDDTNCSTEEYLWLFNWLNKKMFDYRGLIPMGMALEAPKGMYKELKR